MGRRASPVVVRRPLMLRSPVALCLSVVGATLVGCGGGPSRVPAPGWKPARFADAVLKELDADGDGAVDEQEIQGAPGLKYGARHIDTDGDRRLSREELVARFEMYRQSKLAVMRRDILLQAGGRPLADAKIRLEPEFFLTGVVETASDTSFPDGGFLPQTEGLDLPGVRPGYYRVVVEESPRVQLAEAYSSAATTPLGVEFSPISDGGANYGAILLRFETQ